MTNLREHVLNLLREEHAHPLFESAIANLPDTLRGRAPEDFPHSVWQLVEHMRIAQWDIIEYALNAKHVSPEFPDGYWPSSPVPRQDEWDNSVDAFRADFHRLLAVVVDESVDLLAPIPHAKGATILRQALLVVDHNAYHIGQIVAVRRLLGAWR
jgi:uncharacterized damage-inducible protein DinB